ncbi:MAG: VanZ family protein [Cyclobacteriaceae bacterium]
MISPAIRQKIYVIGWSLIILFFTLSPKGPEVAPLIDIPHFDKVGHFGLFFILSLLLYYPIKSYDHKFKWLFFWCYNIIMGMGTEYIQTFIPNRSGDVFDFIANMLGTGIGLFVISNINFRS